MKRILILFLTITLLFSLAACSALKQPEKIMIEDILDTSEYTLKKELIGQDRQEILDRFGEPDGTLSGLQGDAFLIPYSDQMLVVYYDNDGIVSGIKIEMRQK